MVAADIEAELDVEAGIDVVLVDTLVTLASAVLVLAALVPINGELELALELIELLTAVPYLFAH